MTKSPFPQTFRYHSLDFWRGVACLLVIVYHSVFYMSRKDIGVFWSSFAYVVDFFWLGVPLFFVISGYCIAAAVDSARQRSFSVKSYFLRRFRRIYPPFWTFVALTALVVVIVEHLAKTHIFFDNIHPIANPFSLNITQWLGNLTLTEQWRANVSSVPRHLFVGHAWTLCYEEQFYAVMGLILLAFPRRFFTATAVVTGLCLVARHLLPTMGLPVKGFFFDGQWLMFAAGILVYRHVNYGRVERNWRPILLLCVGIIYSLRDFDPTRALLYQPHIDLSAIFALLFAIVLLFLHKYDDQIASCSLLRPIATCGTMCYSLYLIHWPVTKLISHIFSLSNVKSPLLTFTVTVPICIAASILSAWMFHLYVERKFLNSPSRSMENLRDALEVKPQEAAL